MRGMRGPVRRRLSSAGLFAGAMVTVGVMVAACGGSTQAAEDPNNLGKLKVIETDQYDVPMAGADAAQELGLWKGTSLSVQIGVGEQLGQALASGDTDVAIGSPNRIIGAITQGLDAKIVGPTIGSWDQYIVASKKSGATKPADLKGGKFGISSFGSAGDYSTAKLAESLGWKKSDYKEVTMGNLQGLEAGLKNGTIDAFLWSAFPAYTLQKSGDAKVLGSVRDDIGPNPLDVIAVNGKTLKERPRAVKAFCDGYYKAVRTLQADPKKTQDMFVKKWDKDPKVTPQVIHSELGLLSKNGTITDPMMKNMIDATKYTVQGTKSLDMNTMHGLYKNCDSL